MKKILLLTIALVGLFSQNAYGWGNEGHDAVAYIAECNLNKKAKKTIEKYLGNHSIVYYASWMDYYRDTPPYKHTTVWHMARVDKNLYYTDAVKSPKGDAVSALEESIEMLKNYKNLDDSTVAVRLKYIIHIMGDMHCPVHVDYTGLNIWFNVKFFGKKTTYHALWDSRLINEKHRWHYTEWQQQLDRCSKEEKAKIAAGTPREWFHETAVDCRYLYDIVKPDDELGPDYLNANIGLAEKQILKAGYRLANILNELFD